ncbi:hypothetical protein GCM10011335_42270 [Aureimonas glaciei]|uniref:Tetratricopeptide repeat protein n=1 Tax=Aureimonas glaciei TaxID=1776957 RepID=A0A916Y9K5_9HYPH|nr:hypothetical protein GCM10011335_42270 [Aureimonas glaciei]
MGCPLDGHKGPRAHHLHRLWQLAQLSSEGEQYRAEARAPAQSKPGGTEIGAYGRDLPSGAAAPQSKARPKLYDNLGRLSWPAAGQMVPEARSYFDQGYRLGWGFNHAEAARAFRAAQELDPNCAMCFWGEAWVLGPHINYPMQEDANARALAALQEARRRLPNADEKQAAVIEALARRHSADAASDRRALDEAYADAMQAVQARFPEDAHIAVLTADAIMNLSPWDYWGEDGRTPKGRTAHMVALLEAVLGDTQLRPLVPDPDHPGAIHLYIHAVEASNYMERAIPHARRLEALMPGAGHLVHMPSHIWYRTGRWRDSLEANIRAAKADEDLIQQGGASLLYAEGYHAHNVHFILTSALMGGDGATALGAAEALADMVSDRAKRDVPWTQPIAAAPYAVHAHFSAPDKVLALPEPAAGFPFVRAAWHYARGVVLARTGRRQAALDEAAAIDALTQAPDITAMPAQGVPGPALLAISAKVIEARVAQADDDHAKAAGMFAELAAIQDQIPYMEPPFWYYPLHQSVGAALLEQGRAEEAEAAFRAALERSPNNGWVAAGLLRAAEMRGDVRAAEDARLLMQKNWFGASPPDLGQL